MEKFTKKLDALGSIVHCIAHRKNPKLKLPYFKNLSKDQNSELTKNLNILLKQAKKYKKAKGLISEYEEIFENELKNLS